MERICLIYLWRKSEDFPELFDAWDALLVDHEPDGFNKKLEEARGQGEVRVLKITHPVDPFKLFEWPEAQAEAEDPQ